MNHPNHRAIKTVSRIIVRRKAAAVAALALLCLLSEGCVSRMVTNSWAGLVRHVQGSRQVAANSMPKTKARKISPPDNSIRQVFDRQIQNAVAPLDDNRTVRTLESRLRLKPEDVAARLEIAGIYERYGLPDDALEHYKQALNEILNVKLNGPLSENSEPNPVTGASDREAEAAANGAARVARAARRGAEAIPLLEAFLKKFPAAGVWNELGMLYDEAGDRPSAEKAFREAVAGDAKSEEFHNNLGYNLLLQNRPEAAEREFRRALELNPKSTAAHNNLGTALARRGDRDGAFEQFRMASGDVATAHNNLAVVLLEMGAYERSRDELMKALSARYYFAPPLENFKLVQELLQKRAKLLEAGSGIPLRPVRLPPPVLAAAGPPELANQEGGTEGCCKTSSEPRKGTTSVVPTRDDKDGGF